MSHASRIFEGRFGRVIVRDDADPVAQHSHNELHLIILFDGAPRQCQVAGEQMLLTREGILLVNAGVLHQSEAADAPARSRVVTFFFSPAWLLRTFPAAFVAGDPSPCPSAWESITPHIRQLADAMVIEMLNDRFLSSDRLEFMVQELMLSIVDTYLARRRASSPMWRGSPFADSRIRRAIALLRARPNKDVNMDRIATQVGLSRSRFYDLFQLCTGRSPREYLDLLCVGTAITRLSKTDIKIADVSAELGFSAQSNFTRFFLNQVGASPSEFRRACSGATASRDTGADIGLPPAGVPPEPVK